MLAGMFRLAWAMLIGLVVWPAIAQAQVIADGSLGSVVNQAGAAFNITGGTKVGPNRFHSFTTFNVAAGQAAVFQNDPGVSRILARVTGGGPSAINGLIRSQTSGAHLYLMNPAGIVFGGGAALDVAGSFTATTADFVRLADGSRFDATPGVNDSTLSAAAPESFGFLSTAPAAIEVNSNAGLAVTGEHGLTLVGGDVTIDGGQLRAADGRIAVTGIAAAGSLPADLDAVIDAATTLAQVQLRNGAIVSAQGDGSGRVLIRAGRIVIENPGTDVSVRGETQAVATPGRIDLQSAGDIDIRDDARVRSVAVGATPGGDVSLMALGEIRIVGNLDAASDTAVGSAALSDAPRAGDVTVMAPVVQLQNDVSLFSLVDDAAAGGSININANALLLLSNGGTGGDVVTSADVGSTGDLGSINIQAQQLLIFGGGLANLHSGVGRGGDINILAPDIVMSGGRIFAGVFADATGGNVNVETQRLLMSNGSVIGALSLGDGAAGEVAILSDRVNLTGENTRLGSPAEGFDTSVSGSIGVRTKVLRIADDASIITNNNRSVPGGQILLEADRLKIDSGGRIAADALADGDGSVVAIQAGVVTLTGGGRITSTTQATGNAGAIGIKADDLRLIGEAFIDASTSASGGGGGVVVEVDRLLLDGARAQMTAVTREGSTGGGGGLRIEAKRIHVRQGASIGASSFGTGDAGVVAIDTTRLELFSDTPGTQSVIASQSINDGRAGSIIINAEQISLTGRTGIFVDSLTDDRAGNIILIGRTLSLSGRSTINSAALGAGNSGRILIAMSGDVQMTQGASISARTFPSSPADAGRIRLAVGSVLLDDSRIFVRSERGNSGNLIVRSAGPIVLANDSLLSAEAARNGGNVLLQSPSGITITDSSILAQVGGDGGRILLITLLDPDRVVQAPQAPAASATPANVAIAGLLGPGPVTINNSLINGLAGGQDVEVRILATPLVLSTDSRILTSNAFFVPTDVSGQIARLRGADLNRQIDLQDACRVLLTRDVSTLTLTGRGGAAPLPRDWLSPGPQLP
jgi:filamentous hemagglutinin family protein